MTDETAPDPYVDAFNAERLRKRIAAVLRRAPKAVPVALANGTTLLRGRRRADRDVEAVDRRGGERRRS